MEDIAQKLLSKIQSSLEYDIGNSKKLKELAAKIDRGMATYDELNDYAYELGGMLSKAYDTNLSSDVLPDGRMDYDIADNIITPTFTNNYDMAADAAMDVQKQININNGIGLNAIRPEFNSDRIDGVVDRVSKADVFDDIKGFLQSAAVNYTQSVIDDTIKANAEFQHKAGLNAKIKRYPTSKCCKWCASLAGVYEYPDVPKDVYRRHQNCNCKLEFIPKKGKKQDVWTKEWINESESSKIELRKQMGLSQNISEIKTINKKVYQDERFVIHPDKINKFLLKPGAKHSKEFFDVGYLPDDYAELYKDIAAQFDMEKAKYDEKSSFGQGFSIDMQLGITKKRTFKTVWQIDKNGDKPRLITAHRRR